MARRARILSTLIASLFLALWVAMPVRAQEQHTLAHAVQPGDTLLDLTLFYGVSSHDLIALNQDLDGPTPIGSGQTVNVPVAFEVASELADATRNGPVTYVVQRGDTLFRIAARFNVGASAIAQANGIYNIDTIYAGQILTIPAEGEVVQPLPPPASDPAEAPLPTLAEGKQIVVSLFQQRTYAYEKGVLLRQFVISSGLPGTPTVKGDFAVYLKYEAQDMSGPGYYLPNVPWVMYFYRGYSLHGTYWHDNFGQPMSHGCVNMRTPEAEWLFQWAPIGTAVRVVD